MAKSKSVNMIGPGKDYEARWDAETLANAEKIKQHKSRMAAAAKAAKAMAEERAQEVKAMKKVARKLK